MLVKISTDKTVRGVAAALQASRPGQSRWRHASYNLKETIVEKGVEFECECLIFEVCQPQHAKKIFDQNPSVSTALPCRISIYEESGKTILASLKPITLLAMCNVPQLEVVTQEVEDLFVKIMKEEVSG